MSGRRFDSVPVRTVRWESQHSKDQTNKWPHWATMWSGIESWKRKLGQLQRRLVDTKRATRNLDWWYYVFFFMRDCQYLEHKRENTTVLSLAILISCGSFDNNVAPVSWGTLNIGCIITPWSFIIYTLWLSLTCGISLFVSRCSEDFFSW